LVRVDWSFQRPVSGWHFGELKFGLGHESEFCERRLPGLQIHESKLPESRVSRSSASLLCG